MEKLWEEPKDSGTDLNITKKATVAYHQQANDTKSEQCWIYNNTATMDEELKHQVIESVEDTYIAELHNKFIGYMWVKAIHTIQQLMVRYRSIAETYIKDNHIRFDNALYTTMAIGKYFERFDYWIQYVDNNNKTYQWLYHGDGKKTLHGTKKNMVQEAHIRQKMGKI